MKTELTNTFNYFSVPQITDRRSVIFSTLNKQIIKIKAIVTIIFQFFSEYYAYAASALTNRLIKVYSYVQQFPLDIQSMAALQRDGVSMNPQQTPIDLLKEKIKKNPHNYEAYYQLGLETPPFYSFTLLDETEMNRQKLFLKTIELNPKYAKAYYQLTDHLEDEETPTQEQKAEIKLPNGEMADKRILLMKALEYDPLYIDAYCALGCDMLLNEKILLGGDEMSRQEIFQKAIKLNPKNKDIYLIIGDFIKSRKEEISIEINEKQLSQQLSTPRDFYLKALEHHPNDHEIYLRLASTIEGDEKIAIPGQEEMMKQQMLRKKAGDLIRKKNKI